MDKQKQIAEMATEIARTILSCPLNQGRHCDVCKFNDKDTISYDCQSYLVAEKLLEKYQPKIPEGAVVLTEEEYEQVYGIVKAHDELLKDLQEAKSVFEKEMEEAQKEFVKQFEEYEKEVRKETAEKFAEMLKAKFAYDIERCKAVDEICKEITGGDKQ